jgi:hypothetical protein
MSVIYYMIGVIAFSLVLLISSKIFIFVGKNVSTHILRIGDQGPFTSFIVGLFYSSLLLAVLYSSTYIFIPIGQSIFNWF